MVPETTLIGSESVTLTGDKWLFAPTLRDHNIVELERERLAAAWGSPCVARVTRSDAIRSLFLRAYKAEIDAEIALRKAKEPEGAA